MARATVGKGDKMIPVASVTAVQFKPAGMVRGFIQFTVPGGNEDRSRFGKQSIDKAKDENSVLFGVTQKAAFEQLRDAVQAAIVQRHAPITPAATAPTGVAAELKQLGELRESGVISPEEFEAQKAKLLGN